MSYVSMDLETTIRSSLKRKASPFYNQNRIVAVGYKRKGDKGSTGKYFTTGKDDTGMYVGGAPDGWLRELCYGAQFVVTFNGKFDILHAICQGPLNRQAWIEFIDGGGMVWDCQLAEYLLHGMTQEFHMASMDETAPRYGGNLKDDAVKSLWAAGVDTCDIDKTLLMDYLLGTNDADDVGDIGNTEKMFLGQLAAFRARGGLRSALLNMGALCFTIEAEYNGMYVDKDWALAKAKELEVELGTATAELNGFIPELPEGLTFNWNSRFHKSALIFGGKVKYTAKVPIMAAEGGPTYVQKDEVHYVLVDGTTTATPPAEDFDNLWRYTTYGSGKNKGEYKTKKVKVDDLTKQKFRNEDMLFEFPGYTEPDAAWESKSDEGVYSTAADVIEALGLRNLPFTKALAKRADIHKDLSTYYITTDEKTGEQKGMLTLVGEDGLIHHKLNMTNTVTARLSSSDPNLQNVSKGEYDLETFEEKGSQIKRAFISRFRGGKIIQSDFTSLEIYVQAILTMCRQLIEDLKAGLDMHVLRAEQAWGKEEGKDYEYILKASKDDKHPEHKKWKKKRGNAKVFSFQRAYGAGVKKIALTTGMTEEEVEDLIKAEAERYPELGAYIDHMMETIKQNRVSTQRFVPHPDAGRQGVPAGLTCQLGRSYFTTPDGKMYSFSESPSPVFIANKPASKGGCAQSFSPTEIKNYPVQGTGAEWAKASMYMSLRAYYRRYVEDPKRWLGRALLVSQVHDAVYVDAADDIAVEAAALLEAAMLESSNYMEWWFKWPLPLGVPCETKMGDNMMIEESPPAPFHDLVHLHREEIRRNFIGNHTPSFEG
ncbi:DNA polymerase I [Xanthomonas phage f20-Xaj]|uniref:DNA polymerase I n=1 Tax=Xanthomonas phage f20-Xaj TaxID=1784979 RepID=A0A127AVJ4_9CAUD|nr:DNA polymerase [Xanthomonas phage f20-Xaj]AMM44680.1 DNA polymerase I [Xanthomonas phage f20-Xaj]